MSAIPQPLAVFLQAFLGQPDFTHQSMINYTSPTTGTAGFIETYTANIPTGGGIVPVNLATLFPAATNVQFLAIVDITNPGQPFNFGINNNSPLVAIPASGFAAWMQNGGAPPTIYLSNINAAASQVQIALASQ